MAREIYEKSREEWKDDESGDTPVFADNLNHIEDGIKANSENMALKEIYDDTAISLGRKTDSKIGTASMAYGVNAEASGNYSFAFGASNTASGETAFVTGANNSASGANSSAEGIGNVSSASASHAEGAYTIASSDAQHVQGKFNEEDTEGKYAHIVGGGTYSDRKNIHTIKWNGDAWFAGNVADGNGTTINQLLLMIQDLQSQIQSLQTP